MITGGTGSFGNAVLHSFLKSEIKEIRIFSRDEKKQHDMRLEFNDKRVRYYIGDVKDAAAVKWAMAGVDYVFHAAALKQVPSCEFHPIEAVKTNILGTENVLNAAIDARVKRVICLSTDKAVSPINAMGMSKALMEKVVVAKSRGLQGDQTTLCATRYGNVMASRGSVIPLFVDQIRAGQPLTVTDPHMTRFLMPLSAAIELVLFAYTHGQQGDLFVQKTSACTVLDLAKTLCDIFKVENEIRVIGTRHGEKLHETLVNREEMARAEDLGNYYRLSPDDRDLNYDKYFFEGTPIDNPHDYSSENTHQLSRAELKDLLMSLDYIQRELKAWEARTR
jgi:UDP-N-acetylglucosamine 4,6-dehydratase/5-epimerase